MSRALRIDGGQVLVEGRVYFLLGVIDMHDHILMQFMSYSVGEGFLEANSSHDFIEDVVVDALLHGWQQFDVHWLM